jgi:cell pole-organizing protein PopZ
MTDEPSQKPALGEPSMEDILASIRRILAEDNSRDQDKPPPPMPFDAEALGEREPPEPAPEKPLLPLTLNDAADGPSEVSARPSVEGPAADVFLLTPEMRVGAEPLPDREAPTVMPPPPVEAPSKPPPMVERRVVSTPAAEMSADVLSQLAKAILDRRDIAITTRDVTLEGMVREMLRPLLREWLDRNLPYLIERLVKKEIDLMVNRAERLDD